MEMFLKRSCELMFNFDVYFRNTEVTNYFQLEKVYKLRCWLWYHTRRGFNKKKKLQLTLQNGAGCCKYQCDVISSVAL